MGTARRCWRTRALIHGGRDGWVSARNEEVFFAWKWQFAVGRDTTCQRSSQTTSQHNNDSTFSASLLRGARLRLPDCFADLSICPANASRAVLRTLARGSAEGATFPDWRHWAARLSCEFQNSS